MHMRVCSVFNAQCTMHMHNAGASVQHDGKGKIAKIATMVKDSPKPIDQLEEKTLP